MTEIIDRNGRMPVYHQVASGIERRIASGEWKVGERLPSEVELSRHYEVSRMTVRQALGELEKDGVVLRQRPAGTFVARVPAKLAPTLSIPVSFVQILNSLGHASESVTLRMYETVPSAAEADRLGLDPGEEVTRIERMIGVDGQPVARVDSVVPVSLCPGLAEISLVNNSIHQTIEQHFSIVVVRADHWIEAVTAVSDDESVLFARRGSPILKLTSIYHDEDRPVEHVLTYWLADLMKLHLQTTKVSPMDLTH